MHKKWRSNYLFGEDGDTLTYTATLADGSPLPSWLNIDMQSGLLTGTAPQGSDDISVQITATDPQGLTVSDSFDIDVKAVAVEDSTPWYGGEIDGDSGDDTLNGSWFVDTIRGLDGDDVISSGLGNDTVIGGKGTDILRGGLGSDVYIFNAGDGQDTIDDQGGINDTLVLKDISLSDLLLDDRGDDWILTVENSDDQITIKDADNWWGGRIDNFEIGNTEYSYSEFISAANHVEDNSAIV